MKGPLSQFPSETHQANTIMAPRKKPNTRKAKKDVEVPVEPEIDVSDSNSETCTDDNSSEEVIFKTF